MPLRLRPAAGVTALLLAAALTACSGASDPAEESPADSGAGHGEDAAHLDIGHVHGLGIDPADGTVYVATHHGLVRIAEDGTAERVGDASDYMGFAVTGPGTFLGSGHPAPDADTDVHHFGLLESTDAGRTWTTLSLGGEADFHALVYAHDTVYGYDSTRGGLRVSEDGTTWEDRATLPAADIAVSPEGPDVLLATTQNGIARSTDGGDTFADGRAPVLLYLSWPAPDSLFGIAPDGELSRSTDGGDTWEAVGTVPGGAAQALTALDAGHILAATEGGVYESRDGGETFTERLSS
ncbi:hypothetical protein GCM10009716_18830 [Streptomyces sodiiphilus]|uniref:Exo-alpha-sialidase n=1 Tax=Streptomyces sodiiphilus TaxID=226217 RepID=A0ABP5AH87_9ACTN